MQYFGNLFPLFFALQQKDPCIQSWGHCVALCEATFCQFLSFEAKNSFTEASPSSWLLKNCECMKWAMNQKNLSSTEAFIYFCILVVYVKLEVLSITLNKRPDLVWLSLLAYQHLMGYLMPKFDSFLKVWL